MNEDKNNDFEGGSWWANYQSQEPQPEPVATYYEEPQGNKRKKFIIIGIVALVVVLLLVGGGIAYALLSNQPQDQAQPVEQSEEVVAAPSEVMVYITADGTNEKSGAAKVVITSLTNDQNAADGNEANEEDGSSGTGEEAADGKSANQASEEVTTASFELVDNPVDSESAEGAADGSEGTAQDASGADAGDGTSPDPLANIEGTIIQERDITTNQTISIGNLDPGDYRLYVVSAPVNEDGSTYQIPMNATDFTVGGDGKVVNVFVYLPKVVDGQVQEPTEEELAAAQQEATGSLETQDQNAANSGATGSNSAGNTGASSGNAHTHNWTAVTETVHHDAVYRTVHHEAVKERRTICTSCGSDITNNYTAHKNSTGHTGYRYDTKVVREAYDEKVLVSGAYDETVVTGYKCSGCGATR